MGGVEMKLNTEDVQLVSVTHDFVTKSPDPDVTRCDMLPKLMSGEIAV